MQRMARKQRMTFSSISVFWLQPPFHLRCHDTFACGSGGERSFTTLAFILALAERTESPFRAMDEYDIFMDAATRRIATQTLLQFAMQHDDMQLVLLTPQVRTHVTANSNPSSTHECCRFNPILRSILCSLIVAVMVRVAAAWGPEGCVQLLAQPGRSLLLTHDTIDRFPTITINEVHAVARCYPFIHV
jgi:hypothetical protein